MPIGRLIAAPLACLSFVLGISAQAADVSSRNVGIQLGSYRLTCVVLGVHGNDLKAICQTDNGDWLTAELHNTDRCADISNENGKLICDPSATRLPSKYIDLLGDAVAGNQFLPMRGADQELRHDTWTFKDGAPESATALAQTGDGLLWLGGPNGLYRFDGKQFELFQSPFGDELLSTNIMSLCAPPSGGLWIGYTFGGVSFLENGRVTNYGGEFAANSGSIDFIV